MNKAELTQTIRDRRAAFVALWDGITEAQMTQRPGPQPGWSVKDLIAHVTYWEGVFVENVTRSLRGEATLSGETDTRNARVFTENQDRPLAHVLAEFDRSLERVIEQIEALDDDDLVNPGRFGWLNGRPLWVYAAGETYSHYDDHSDSLRAWRESL